jgi:hypothetical protein
MASTKKTMFGPTIGEAPGMSARTMNHFTRSIERITLRVGAP